MPITVPSGQPEPIKASDFKGAQSPNMVSFQLRSVAPPTPLYIQRDDVLNIVFQSSRANESVVISGRFLLADGTAIIPFTFTAVGGAAYGQNNKSFPLGEGYLLAVSVVPTSSQHHGECFVSLSIVRGVTSINPTIGVMQVLMADYVGRNQPSGWPGGRFVSPLEGPGMEKVLQPANPAAGAEIQLADQTGTAYLPTYFEATLTTSATVANRQPVFRFRGANLQAVGAPANIPASTVITFRVGSGFQSYTDAQGTVHLPMPQLGHGGLASSAFYVTTVTGGIQAADQWSAISYYRQEWLLLS